MAGERGGGAMSPDELCRCAGYFLEFVCAVTPAVFCGWAAWRLGE